MKFCPVVPEICRGQVHGSRKERKRRIIIITRYDKRLWSLPNWPLTTGLKNKSKATLDIEQC
jgi:hypothetical protein